jgi:hypothetical protein
MLLNAIWKMTPAVSPSNIPPWSNFFSNWMQENTFQRGVQTKFSLTDTTCENQAEFFLLTPTAERLPYRLA